MEEEDSAGGAGGMKRSGDDPTSDTSQGHSPAKRQCQWEPQGIQYTHSVIRKVIRTDSAPSASESRPAAAPTPAPLTPQPEAAQLQATPAPTPVTAPATHQPETAPAPAPTPVTAPATPQPEAAQLQATPAPTPVTAPATPQPETAPAPAPTPATPQPETAPAPAPTPATPQPAAAPQPSQVASPPQSAAPPTKHVPPSVRVIVQRLPLPETTQCSREGDTITAPAPQHTTKKILTEKDGASDSCDAHTESDTDDYRRSRGLRDNRDWSTPNSMEKLAVSALINMHQQPDVATAVALAVATVPEPQIEPQLQLNHVLLDVPRLLPILQALDMKYLINNDSDTTELFSAYLQSDEMSVEVLRSRVIQGVRVFVITFPDINRAKHLLNFVDGILAMKKHTSTHYMPAHPTIVGISFSQTDASFIAMVSVMMPDNLVPLYEIDTTKLSADKRSQLWSSVMQCVEMVALCKKRPVYLNRHSVYVHTGSLHCTNMMFFTCVNWDQLTTPTQGLSAIARFVLGPMFGHNLVERAIPADDRKPFNVQTNNVMWLYTVEACWDYNLTVTHYPETWTGRPFSQMSRGHDTPDVNKNILIGQLRDYPLTACLVPELSQYNDDAVLGDMRTLATVLCNAVGQPPNLHTSVLNFGQKDALTAAIVSPIMPKRDSVAIVPIMPTLRDPRTVPLSKVTKWHLPHWMDFTPTGNSPGFVVYEPTSTIDSVMVYKPKIEFPSNRHGTMLSSVFPHSQVWGKSCKLVMPLRTPRSVTNKIIKILSLPMYMRDCQYVPRMFTLLADEPNELKTQQTTTLIAFHDPPGTRALSSIKFKRNETRSATALKSLHVMGMVKCVARTHLMFYRRFGFFWSFTSVSSIMFDEKTRVYSLDLFNVLSENLFVNEEQVKPDKLQFGTTFNPVAFATALVSFLNIVECDDQPDYHRALAEYAETGKSSYLFPDDGTPPESTSMVLYYIATRCKLLKADYHDSAMWTKRVPELSCYTTNLHHKEFMFESNVFSLPLHVSVAHYTVKWTRGTVDVPVNDKAPTYTLNKPKLLSELLALHYLRAQGSAKSRAAPARARAVGGSGSASGRTAAKQSGATDKGSSSKDKGKGKGPAGPTKNKLKSAEMVYDSDSEESSLPSVRLLDPEDSDYTDVSSFSELEEDYNERPRERVPSSLWDPRDQNRDPRGP